MNINKNITSILALIATISYVILLIITTVYKLDRTILHDFSMIEMAVISYYFGDSKRNGGLKDEQQQVGKDI